MKMLKYSGERRSMPMREQALLLWYHLRLLNWWLFLLMVLGFFVAGLLVWFQVQRGSAEFMYNAGVLSRFMLEPGVGLFAGLLASVLIVGDPLLSVVMATSRGLYSVVLWRLLLSCSGLLLCSMVFLGWTLALGVDYARQQGPLWFLLGWLAPFCLMSMLGLLGSLLTRNATLGLLLAVLPLVASLFLYEKLSSIEALHPFFITYTFSGGQDAPDWWINRLTLLALAAGCALCNWWLLRREERLLNEKQ